MRRMVVSCHATVANYEYLVYWRFYQDGNIECEVRATGLMVTTPYAADGTPPPTGTVVDNRTYAPFHQHFLVARLDLDVDGDEQHRAWRSTRGRCRSPTDNPYGLAVVTEATPVALRVRGGPRLQLGDPAVLEGGQPEPDQRASAPTRRTSWCPSGVDPADDGPGHAAVPAGAGDRPHASG